MTANVFEGDRQHCLAVGMDDHLPKPYSKAQLAAMLERWLGAGAAKHPTAAATKPPVTLDAPRTNGVVSHI